MEFRKIFRGYDPQSVDKYIADLTDKNKKIHSSQRERIDELLDENSTLRERIAELQAKENAVSDALVVSRNAALQMERQAKDYSDKALFQAKKFYATWQAYAQTAVSGFTKEELSAFNGLQRKIERVIADYETGRAEEGGKRHTFFSAYGARAGRTEPPFARIGRSLRVCRRGVVCGICRKLGAVVRSGAGQYAKSYR